MSIRIHSFIVSAVIVCMAVGSLGRREPVDICTVPCVGEVYMNYCGGVACGTRPKTAEEHSLLCSSSCIAAIQDESFLTCLRRNLAFPATANSAVSAGLQRLTAFCAASATTSSEEKSHAHTETYQYSSSPTVVAKSSWTASSSWVDADAPAESKATSDVVSSSVKAEAPTAPKPAAVVVGSSAEAEASVPAKEAPAPAAAVIRKKDPDFNDLVDQD